MHYEVSLKNSVFRAIEIWISCVDQVYSGWKANFSSTIDIYTKSQAYLWNLYFLARIFLGMAWSCQITGHGNGRNFMNISSSISLLPALLFTIIPLNFFVHTADPARWCLRPFIEQVKNCPLYFMQSSHSSILLFYPTYPQRSFSMWFKIWNVGDINRRIPSSIRKVQRGTIRRITLYRPGRM